MSLVSRATSDISYRLLVEGIVDVAIFMLELDGTVASWNLAALRIKGYAANEIIGQNFSRILRSDGTLRDVRASARAERDADGAVVALMGIFQDITEQKENERERERERLIERVALATQAGKVGIWEWDVNAETMVWDAHMFTLYGLDNATDRPTFETWKSTLHDDDRARVIYQLYEGLTGRRAFDTEFRIVWPNGETHPIRAQSTIVRNANDKPVRMVCMNWTVTDVRSLAEQLQEEKEHERERERERFYEHERRWSTTFQRAVLPLTLPKVAGCTFDAVYEPGLGDAQVGGDWYDAVHLMDGRILVSIGDVAGSGLEAAVVVGVARQIMRGISQLHANPMLILDAADRALCLEYPGVYVSAWVGLIDLVTHTITYASAGHPPPLLVSRNVRCASSPTRRHCSSACARVSAVRRAASRSRRATCSCSTPTALPKRAATSSRETARCARPRLRS
jgi:PAS domain-containing protein